MVKYGVGDDMDFIQELQKLNIEPNPLMLSQFETYYTFLVEKNQVMNLTAITEKDAVYTKHFLDSLNVSKVISLSEQSLLDVGSGAGFPSIPLKICFPHMKITIIDSLQKRIHFLQELVDKLGLTGVTLIHGRAEEFDSLGSFDIVSARAVARLPILAELCLPFVKKNGHFIAMKSRHFQEEVQESLRAIELLGGEVKMIMEYPIEEEIQHVVIDIYKKNHTPKGYPRSFSQIKKKPL